MADDKKKELVLRCTNIALREDGRQTVNMVKPPTAPTGKNTSGATIVNPNEAELCLVVDAADNYAVGKDYTLVIT